MRPIAGPIAAQDKCRQRSQGYLEPVFFEKIQDFGKFKAFGYQQGQEKDNYNMEAAYF